MLFRRGNVCSSLRKDLHNNLHGGFSVPVLVVGVFSLLTLLVGGPLLWSSLSSPSQVQAQELVEEATTLETFSKIFTVNIPASFKELVTVAALTVEGETIFGDSVTFSGGSVFDGQITLQGDIVGSGVNIDVGSGEITASNILYSLTEGDGIDISEGQTPTITNSDRGSSQNIFKKVKLGDSNIEADSNTDTLEFSAGSGISLSIDTDNDKLIISNSSIPGFTTSGTYAVLSTGITRAGIGTSTPSNTLEVNSGTADTSGITFTQLTSSSAAGVGGGKVLSVDSGGKIILVSDQTGSTPTAESVLPSATNGMTIYFNGTSWVASDNLFHDGGSVGISNAAPTSRFHVNTNLASKIGVIVQGYTSQTANLQEWRDSSGTILSYVDSNGVFNGSANTSGSLNPGFTTGSVAFQGASGLSQDNANFFWDNTNNRLGIGTAAPAGQFEVSYSSASNSFFTNTSGARAFIQPGTTSTLMGNYSNHRLGLTVSGNEYLSIATTGNVGIGTTNPLSKLQVVDDSATTNALVDVGRFFTSTSGTAASGFGPSILFGAERSDAGLTGIARIASIWETAPPSTGANEDAALVFHTALDGSIAEKMRISSAGNVGIGTTSPGAKFVVDTGGTPSQVAIGNFLTNGGIAIADSTGNLDRVLVRDSSNHVYVGDLDDNNANFYLRAGGSTSLTILDGGNVGIGTTSPVTKLQTYGADANNQVGAGVNAAIRIGNSNGAVSGRISELQFANYATAPFAAVSGALVNGSSNSTGNLIFSTRNAATDANLTERMTILSTGNVGIGTTSPHSLLTVAGNLYSNTATISANYAASTALTVNGGPSANAAHIVKVRNNSGTTMLAVDGFGRTSIKASGTVNTDFMVGGETGSDNLSDTLVYFLSRSASQKGLVIRGATSQTANLQEWQDSTGTILSKINAQGELYLPGSTSRDTTTTPKIYITKAATSGGYSSAFVSSLDTNSASSLGNYGLVSYGYARPGDGNTASEVMSIFSQATMGAGTTGLIANYNARTILATGTATNVKVFNIDNYSMTSGTVTNLLGLDIPALTKTGGTLTNQYGIRIGDVNQGATSNYSLLTNAGNVVFNEGGDASTDFRVESDTNANMLFVDASTDRVGIGTSSPNYALEVNGTTRTTSLFTSSGIIRGGSGLAGLLVMNGSNTSVLDVISETNAQVGLRVLGSASQTADLFRAYSDLGTTQVLTLAASGNLGIGTTSPISKLHAQGLTTNAIGLFNQTGSGDILTASSSGTTKLTVSNGGGIKITGGVNQNSFVELGIQGSFTSMGEPYIALNTASITGNGVGILTVRTTSGSLATLKAANLNSTTLRSSSNGITYANIAEFSSNTQAHVGFQGAAVSGIGALFYTDNTANVNLGIKAITSQTANLTEWQNTSGTALASVDVSGVISTNQIQGITNTANNIQFETSGNGVYLYSNGNRLVWNSSNFYPENSAQRGLGTSTKQWLDLWINQDAYIGDNVGIGTTTFGTSAAKVLAIAGSTAPSTAITDGIQMFAVDQAGSHELRVMDEAGNTTTLSPHNFSVIGDQSEEMAWSFYSERNSLAINADMTKALRLVEKLSGEKLVYLKDLESGFLLEDESDATHLTELAENGTIGEIAKWNYELWTYVGEVVFEKPVKFMADITLQGRILFGRDQVGTVTIPSGSTTVKVTFTQEQPVVPIIQITPQQLLPKGIALQEVTKSYFIVSLPEALDHDTSINWFAVLKNPENTAQPHVEVFPQSSPSPIASPIASPHPSPSPTPTPEAQPSPSPSPSTIPVGTSSAELNP